MRILYFLKPKKLHSRICRAHVEKQAIQLLAQLTLLVSRDTEAVEEQAHGLWLAASWSALRGLLGREQRWQSWQHCWSMPASHMKEKLHSDHTIPPYKTGSYWFNPTVFGSNTALLVHCRPLAGDLILFII